MLELTSPIMSQYQRRRRRLDAAAIGVSCMMLQSAELVTGPVRLAGLGRTPVAWGRPPARELALHHELVDGLDSDPAMV